MSSKVKMIKKYYDMGIYTLANVQRILAKGAITQEEYNYIIGIEDTYASALFEILTGEEL